MRAMQIRSLAVMLPSYRILLLSSIMVRIYGNGRHFRELYYRSRVSGGRANFRETPVTGDFICVTACLSPARLRSSRAAAVGGESFWGGRATGHFETGGAGAPLAPLFRRHWHVRTHTHAWVHVRRTRKPTLSPNSTGITARQIHLSLQ